MGCHACFGEGILQGLDMGASRKKGGRKGRNMVGTLGIYGDYPGYGGSMFKIV